MKPNHFNLKHYPLLIPATGLFLGSIILYRFILPVNVLLPALICFLFLIFCFRRRLFNQASHPHIRLLIVFMLFLQLGMLQFSVNDYRHLNFRPTTSKGIYSLVGRVAEVKKWEASKGSYIIDLEFVRNGNELKPVSGKVLVYEQFSTLQERLEPDQFLGISGVVYPIQNKNNPGEFDAEFYYGTKGVSGAVFLRSDQRITLGNQYTISGFFERWRTYLSRSMEVHLDGVFLGVAKALILGDKSDLDQDTVRVFSNTGSMHVLAVSGMHIGMFLLLFNAIFSMFPKWFSKRSALFWSIALIWIYGALSGASPSVMRAVIMFSILALGQLFFRKQHTVNSLFLSAIVLFFIDPYVLFDIGFQLTYAAMFGLIFLYPGISPIVRFKNKWLQMGWEGTAVGLAATITTTPLTLFWFYQFPNYFALANIGVMIFGFFVLVAGIIFLLTSWIPLLNGFVAFLFAISITALVTWVTWVESLPGSVSGGFHVSLVQLCISLLVLILLFYFVQVKQYILLGVGLVFSCLIWICVDRFVYFKQSELIVPVSKQFQLICRLEDKALVLYQPEQEEVLKIPRETQDYLKYAGVNERVIPLNKDHLTVNWGKEKIQCHRSKYGWKVSLNGQSFFYRASGLPQNGESNEWQSIKVQRLNNPNGEFKPVVTFLN